MNAEFDFDLTPAQWETLKALRARTSEILVRDRAALENLITLQLATMNGNRPTITSRGRKVLVRGSPRLWDVAA
jgi:hypothetical protein